MRYQVGDKNTLLWNRKSKFYSSLLLGLLSLVFEVIMIILNNIFNIHIVLMLLISFIFIGTAIIFFVLVFTLPKKIDKMIVKYVEITSMGLVFEYFDGHRNVYSFKELLDKVEVSVGFMHIFEGNEKIYKSMREFFEDAYNFISETMNRYKGIKKVYPVINPIKKGKNIFVLIVSPYIFDLKRFLEDWRENYEAYLKKVGKYDEYEKQYREIRKKKEIKTQNKERYVKIHFYALITIIILAVISFVYLSLIPYLGTSPDSPDYATSLAFLISDGLLTSLLILIGVIKLPGLWKARRKG